MAVVANIFVTLKNGSREIMEVVYGPSGRSIAAYAKHHLVPVVETKFATPGPFSPTSFELVGVTFGLVMCYEGVYPTLTGDWSQLDALKNQGAEVLLWSIGGEVPSLRYAEKIARRTGLVVAAAEQSHPAVVVDGHAAAASPISSTPLSVPGYSGAAALTVIALPRTRTAAAATASSPI